MDTDPYPELMRATDDWDLAMVATDAEVTGTFMAYDGNFRRSLAALIRR
jgi:hypothetical protein